MRVSEGCFWLMMANHSAGPSAVSRQLLRGLYSSVEEKLKVVIVLIMTNIILGRVKQLSCEGGK